MHLALGVGLLSSAALVFAWAYAAHRRPVPARWTRIEILSSGVCLLITGLLPIGIGLLGVAAAAPQATVRSLGPVSIAVVVASVALCWVAIPRLRRAAAGAPVTAVPASRPAPPPAGPTRPVRTRRAPDRAA